MSGYRIAVKGCHWPRVGAAVRQMREPVKVGNCVRRQMVRVCAGGWTRAAHLPPPITVTLGGNEYSSMCSQGA